MDISKWTNILKLKPVNIFPVIIFTGILLFAPKSWHNAFRLATFIDNYCQWLYVAFIASISLLSPHVFIYINTKVSDFKYNRGVIFYLQTLTKDEINILKPYIIKKSRTQQLDIRDGVVTGLAEAQIIYSSSEIGHLDSGFSFNINKRAWDYLNKHKRLLGLKQS